MSLTYHIEQTLSSFAVMVCFFLSRAFLLVELTLANFKNEVMNSDSVWIVEFYDPGCGYCQNLTPEYRKVATALKGVIKVN